MIVVQFLTGIEERIFNEKHLVPDMFKLMIALLVKTTHLRRYFDKDSWLFFSV